ncbi:hypothetical protein AHAS_Ahas03G0240200 [Arachis hypogaea]
MELDAIYAILAQNKLLSQQMSLITQQLSGIQVLTVNTQNAPQDASYDMSGGFTQGKAYDYTQFHPEQDNFIGNSPRNPNDDLYSKTFNQGGEITQTLGGEINLSGSRISIILRAILIIKTSITANFNPLNDNHHRLNLIILLT